MKVALLAEGGDRNRTQTSSAQPPAASPSSRRAGIEMWNRIKRR